MKILVHLHVFYHDQVPWFLESFRSLKGRDWDLVVTECAPHAQTEKLVRSVKPDARFVLVENRGYDVWPFLYLLSTEDWTGYDVVFKLHTKHITGSKVVHLNHLHLKGSQWRDLLVEALLGSEAQVQEILQLFQDRPEVGMVCAGKLYTRLHFPEDEELLEAELERLGLRTEERRFCSGTMMAFRPGVLQVLRGRSFCADMFPEESPTDGKATMAHVYERVLSLLAPAQGFAVVTTGEDAAYRRRQWRKKHLQGALSWVFSIDNSGPHHEKMLTVLGLKFKIGVK